MTVFPTAAHAASWADLCPGNHESAGKRKTGKPRTGNRWLRIALIEAALGAIHTRNSAFGARYRRVMRHRGHKKAVVAVAHALLVTVYQLIARRPRIRNPELTTTTGVMPSASRAGPSRPSSVRATGSRWSASPEREVEPTGGSTEQNLGS
jgi:hypothetical protein